MANYIVNNQKKRRVLAKREAALSRLVAAGAPQQKIIEVATEVLASRVRVLRAQLAALPPTDVEAAARIEAKIASLQELPVSAVLREFRCPDEE